MGSNFRDVSTEDLLRETAWLKELSRTLVADPHSAEDVAQEAWLALAGQETPVVHRRTWLSRVVRNLALRLTARESQRREREARAARPEAQPSAESSLERVRIQGRIVAAVLQLPEPQRTTVVLRYFDELPPREIASRMGAPVETVRSRLKSALARMRAELDREFSSRGAWTSPLVTMLAAPAVIETGLLVGAIMKSKTLLAAAALLVLTTGYVLFSVGSPSGDASGISIGGPVASASEPGEDPASSLQVASQDAANGRAVGADRTSIPPDTSNTVTLVGLCIDAVTKAPVPGITLTIQPRAPRQVSAREPWADLDPPSPGKTSADGRFVLTFETAPGWSFQLGLSGVGIVPMTTAGQPLDPGKLDLGTLEVTLGSIVRGRVVDEAGLPLSDQTVRVDKGRIRFEQEMEGRSGGMVLMVTAIPSFRQRQSFSGVTGPDGAFEVSDPVPPDTWIVHLWERRRLLEETTLEVLPGEAEKWVDLTAERAVDALSGVVVDDLGRPIAEASVSFELSTGGEWSESTGEDGTFDTPGFARDPDGMVTVYAYKSGHTGPDPMGYEWGSSIELELARGGILDIFVREAETGSPVTDYGVRILRIPERTGAPSDALLRHIGHHDGGHLRVPGLLEGPSLVMVEPARVDLEPSWFEPVELAGGQVSQIEIPLRTGVSRGVRVEDAEGTPVAGSTVELLRIPGSGRVDAFTRADGRPSLRSLTMDESALVLAEGATDEQGRVELRAAPSGDLAVRVTGAHHQPSVVNGIEFRAGMPDLVLRVVPGAEVVGQFSPVSALRWLEPGVHIERVGDTLLRRPERGRLPVSEDGSFRFSNVPEGSWKLVLSGNQSLPDSHSLLATLADLRPGERRDLSLDVSDLVPARLLGRVYLDGAPVGATVSVQGIETVSMRSRPVYKSYGRVTSDSAGRFDLYALEGRFRLQIEIDGKRWSSEGIVELFTGQEAGGEFRFTSRQFAARLVDSGGEPLADRDVEVLWKEGTWPAYDIRTDTAGYLVLDPAPPGTFSLGLRPPELASPDAWRDHWDENGPKAYESLIKLGPLEASGTSTVTLRVPDRDPR